MNMMVMMMMMITMNIIMMMMFMMMMSDDDVDDDDNDDDDNVGRGGVLRVKDLQNVFSSSLVSTASLEFLSIANVIEEDYADIK